MSNRLKLAAGAGIAALLLAGPAGAAVVTYRGYDAGTNAPGANALAAADAFDAATNTTIIDFESFLPTGVFIDGFGTITGSPGGAASLYGENTTAGGDYFLQVAVNTVTFNFITPISAFGAFFGGMQVDTTAIVFLDGGGVQTVNIGGDPDEGGFAFVGFTDFGQSITAVTIDSKIDVFSVDDVRFGGRAAVPEPGAWALMLAGFGLAGAAIRNRRRAFA